MPPPPVFSRECCRGVDPAKTNKSRARATSYHAFVSRPPPFFSMGDFPRSPPIFPSRRFSSPPPPPPLVFPRRPLHLSSFFLRGRPLPLPEKHTLAKDRGANARPHAHTHTESPTRPKTYTTRFLMRAQNPAPRRPPPCARAERQENRPKKASKTEFAAQNSEVAFGRGRPRGGLDARPATRLPFFLFIFSESKKRRRTLRRPRLNESETAPFLLRPRGRRLLLLFSRARPPLYTTTSPSRAARTQRHTRQSSERGG